MQSQVTRARSVRYCLSAADSSSAREWAGMGGLSPEGALSADRGRETLAIKRDSSRATPASLQAQASEAGDGTFQSVETPVELGLGRPVLVVLVVHREGEAQALAGGGRDPEEAPGDGRLDQVPVVGDHDGALHFVLRGRPLLEPGP